MKRIAIGVLLGLGGVGGALAAPNDYEVQAVSNAPAIKVGATFAKGARIVIPADGRVTFIDRTGGSIRTKVCAGKYDGPVESCKAPRRGRGGSDVPGGTRGGQ